MPPPGLGGSTAWQTSGSEWIDPFGPIWVFQGPNCPKIKPMGSPPITNLIIMLTTINPKTISAAYSGASITSSGEFPANFFRSSDEPSVMLLRTSGKLLDLRRSTWQVPTSFFGKLMDFSDLFPQNLRRLFELLSSSRTPNVIIVMTLVQLLLHVLLSS